MNKFDHETARELQSDREKSTITAIILVAIAAIVMYLWG
jgi:hypothetical protein